MEDLTESLPAVQRLCRCREHREIRRHQFNQRGISLEIKG
jgi:hypothetical protein